MLKEYMIMQDEKDNITFHFTNNKIFQVRVAAIPVAGDKILLQKFNGDSHWCLLGGRIHLFENSADAVLREVKEETGYDAKIIRFICSAENLFTFNNKTYHEIGFYYLVSLLTGDNDPMLSDSEWSDIDDNISVFKWHKIKDLPSLRLCPSFLEDKIANMCDVSNNDTFHINQNAVDDINNYTK
jgi:8-oxo-dGTP pyrophosphatase MutT (NUDIX family)